MIILRIATSIFVFFAISRAYLRFKDRSLGATGFFLWTSIWALALLFIFDPNLSSIIAELTGLGRGADAAFLLSIILIFYLIFRLYIKIDTIDKNLTTLVIKLSKEQQINREISEKTNQ
ncbi:MAG: DUF2304 family protein [Candidatus Moraniibacteriota bacterium]